MSLNFIFNAKLKLSNKSKSTEGMTRMILHGAIPFAHELLQKTVSKGAAVVDATCGNGNDTLFLSEAVGEQGHVYAFDIQWQAIETTSTLLKEHKRENVTLIHDSHANVDQYIKEEQSLDAAVFNLGYLPRSDKKIITKPDSTIAALEKLLNLLKQGGLIVLVVYAGHPGGEEEKEAVLQFASSLDQKHYLSITYKYINMINNPPFVIAIEKK